MASGVILPYDCQSRARSQGGEGKWVGWYTRTYVETSSSSSCTCGYRSNPEGWQRLQRRSAEGYWSVLSPPIFHPLRRFRTAFLRVPQPPPPPRRSGPALRVAPPPVTVTRLFAPPASRDGSRMRALVPPIISTVPSLSSRSSFCLLSCSFVRIYYSPFHCSDIKILPFRVIKASPRPPPPLRVNSQRGCVPGYTSTFSAWIFPSIFRYVALQIFHMYFNPVFVWGLFNIDRVVKLILPTSAMSTTPCFRGR